MSIIPHMELLLDTLIDAVKDTARLLPFLYLTYLLMEYLEEKAQDHTVALVRKTGKLGPLAGGLLGILPQCGFSAAASSLYAGGVITLGTLLAIFLSTSDEMLPIFISETVSPGTIVRVLAVKALIGIVMGFLFDLLNRLRNRGRDQEAHRYIHDLCEQDHCHCEEGNIFLSALRHMIQIAVFIFLISIVVGLLIGLVGEDALAGFLTNRPVTGVLLAGLVGLIPNCGASVMITELYIKGILGAGQMLAGLLVGAGVGLLVLFRVHRNIRKNLQITAILYICGVAWGLLIELLHVSF